ncbi:Ctr copper transporter family-domain-containing protein [Phlyctochytrium arcticum]|nr:Ctr copper transporter family-domain-containing protein [Phlyctochytrium arcticum]
MLSTLLLSALLGTVAITAQTTPACPTTPSDPACASFRMTDPDATSSLNSLCTQMEGMPGCTVRITCTSNAASIPDGASHYCTPFSLLANICSVDMPNMGDCKNYVAQCGNSTTPASQVLNPQCSDAKASTPLPNLPTSKQATQQIKSICTEMAMPGCEACSIASPGSTYAQCDLLGTYSLLCKAMPDMKQCSDWKTMCASSPNLPYCSSSGGGSTDPPIMKMFFHTGLTDYVLFETWVPRTPAQYAGTWIAIFVFGILYEGWVAFVAVYESKYFYTIDERRGSSSGPSGSYNTNTGNTDDTRVENVAKSSSPSEHSKSNLVYTTPVAPTRRGLLPPRLFRALLRGVSKFVTVTCAYALMLLAMTYNVGLFFAVVLGVAVGSAVFAEWMREAGKSQPGLRETGRETLCC